MGREIIFEVRDNNKPIWPEEGHELYVCGRDSATQFIASYVLNSLPDNQDEDAESVVLLRVDDSDLTYLKERLEEFLEKDNKEIQKAKDALEDMREARKHANYEDFFKFSESMESTQEWLDAEDWSRAGSMLEYLNCCINAALDYINADNNPNREALFERYKIAIIWSE